MCVLQEYVVPNCRVVSSYSSKETYILQSMAVKKFSSNSLSSFFSMPPEVAHSSLKTSSSSPSSCKNFEATIIETRKRSVGEMLLKYLGLDDLNLEKIFSVLLKFLLHTKTDWIIRRFYQSNFFILSLKNGISNHDCIQILNVNVIVKYHA